MRILLSILLTIVCWGIYGPVLHWGQHAMGGDRLIPFICVGIAYFLIAVVVPGVLLYLRDENGRWTVTGTIWSLIAGAAGAIGALGIILALGAGGKPVYVMPIVFGGAPVVNSFLTIYMARSLKQVGPIFIAGLILVITGATTVLVFRPMGSSEVDLFSKNISTLTTILLALALVVVNWGVYGPILHKGQMKMDGSRLRPLMCVGLAYFAVAVLVPLLYMGVQGGASPNTVGILWSLLAGAAGAVGALGVIMAFNYGGRPIYVMPLIFGGAPIVNTFFSMYFKGSGSPSPIFYAGLLLAAAGAVTVLVFAPRGGHTAPKKEKPKKETPEAASP